MLCTLKIKRSFNGFCITILAVENSKKLYTAIRRNFTLF